MRCPFCRSDTRVVDTREVGNEIRRRRECNACQQRFTTYERLAAVNTLVVKRDNRREEFNRDKLRRSILLACTKRPISSDAIENLVSEVEAEIYRQNRGEVPSVLIGELVMEKLRRLDDVAYVRFASVYRDFRDVEMWAEEIRRLKERKEREEMERQQLRLAL
ncbi:MAG: transcriptional regulator NrdR [Anaerolineae bacterium]